MDQPDQAEALGLYAFDRHDPRYLLGTHVPADARWAGDRDARAIAPALSASSGCGDRPPFSRSKHHGLRVCKQAWQPHIANCPHSVRLAATSPPLPWGRGRVPSLTAGASSPPSSGGEVAAKRTEWGSNFGFDCPAVVGTLDAIFTIRRRLRRACLILRSRFAGSRGRCDRGRRVARPEHVAP